MPPNARITRDMIVDAAVEVARESGDASINARSVAGKLGCSTQPVMYHFDTIAELRSAAYEQADRLHTAFLLDVSPEEDPMMGLGLNYIRFAVREPHLFRFLFQSGTVISRDLEQIIDSGELQPVLAAMQEALGESREKVREIFLMLAVFVHGYASLIANNAFTYEENTAARYLERAFYGAVAAAGGEETK